MTRLFGKRSQDGQDAAPAADPAPTPAAEAPAPDGAPQADAGDSTGEAAGDPAGSNGSDGDEQTAATSPDSDEMAELAAEYAAAAGIPIEDAAAAIEEGLAEVKPESRQDALAWVNAMIESAATGGPLADGSFAVNAPALAAEPAAEVVTGPEQADTWVRNVNTGHSWLVTASRAQTLVDSGDFVPVLEGEEV